MAERKLDRAHKAQRVQFGTIRGAVVCVCGVHMHTDHQPEPRAVCYNKDCDHYRVTFTIEYPQILMVQYTDTVPIHDDHSKKTTTRINT